MLADRKWVTLNLQSDAGSYRQGVEWLKGVTDTLAERRKFDPSKLSAIPGTKMELRPDNYGVSAIFRSSSAKDYQVAVVDTGFVELALGYFPTPVLRVYRQPNNKFFSVRRATLSCTPWAFLESRLVMIILQEAFPSWDGKVRVVCNPLTTYDWVSTDGWWVKYRSEAQRVELQWVGKPVKKEL